MLFTVFFGNASVAENLHIDPDDLLDENCFTAVWTAVNKIDNTNDPLNFILESCKPYLEERNLVAGLLIKFQHEVLKKACRLEQTTTMPSHFQLSELPARTYSIIWESSSNNSNCKTA